MAPRFVWSSFVLLAVGSSCSDCREQRPPSKPSAQRSRDAAARPRNPATTPLDDRFRFDCGKQKAGCRGVLPLRDAFQSSVAVLDGGEDAFRARIASLRAAKQTIRIQALIFRGDESGLFIAELLQKKKAQGVDVKIIVDAVSNLDWKTQWMYFDLKKSGIEVEGYEALYLQWLTAEKPSDPLRANKRFHEKMWIIDGEQPEGLAIVGGLNIANEYFRVDAAPINRWLDQDVALRGVVVKDVTRTFDRNYRFFKRIKRRLPALFNPDNAWKLASKLSRKIRKTKVPFWRRPEIQSAIDKMLEHPAKLGWVGATMRFIQSRPRLSETYIEQAYLSLIDRAKKQVLIANAYFVPDRVLNSALKRAARRGVRVVILTNSPETNDIRSVALVSRHLYLDLLKTDGIEIHEWQGKPFNEGTLHAKYAVFDDADVIVGSYNLDPRSARLNSESAVVLREAGLGRKLATTFRESLLPMAKRISVAQARGFHKPEEIGPRFELLFSLPLKQWL